MTQSICCLGCFSSCSRFFVVVFVFFIVEDEVICYFSLLYSGCLRVLEEEKKQ